MNKNTITLKQKEIILLLYTFRFLDRVQIQTLLTHKTFNRVNTWLKELYENQYIGRILDTESKIQNIPAIYYIAKRGIIFLKDQDECEKHYLAKLYKESDRSDEFIHTCLFIANVYIQLWLKYQDSKDFIFFTQSRYSLKGLIKEISPSFLYRKEKDKPYYVAELFKEKVPRYAIRARIQRYIQFFTQTEWVNQELTPNLLFICAGKKQEEFISKFTQKILTEEFSKLNIYTSTKNQIRDNGIEGEVWNKIEN